jgi:16S rRNA G966 N2-methylase RsmD
MSKAANPRIGGTGTEQQALWVLHQEECLRGLARLPDTSVDVVITDPPYEAECHTSHRLVARAGGKLALNGETEAALRQFWELQQQCATAELEHETAALEERR